MLWHRVIALTWIDNPDGLPQIDHINHDINDNAITNLRWTDAKGNQDNCRPRSKIMYSRYSPTKVVDKEGNIVAEYPTLIEACEDYNISIAHALEMIRGRRPAKSWGTFTQEPVGHAEKKLV